MIIATIAVLLLVAILGLNRKRARQLAFPSGALVPSHYKAFTEIEKQLREATRTDQPPELWDATLWHLKKAETELVASYLRGLRDDFAAIHRVFGAIITYSPASKGLLRFEVNRMLVVPFHFYRCYAIVWLALKTQRVRPMRLRVLTQVISAAANVVPGLVQALETSTNINLADLKIWQ